MNWRQIALIAILVWVIFGILGLVYYIVIYNQMINSISNMWK